MRGAARRGARPWVLGLAAVVTTLTLAAPPAISAPEPPWKQAADLRRLLADAEKALIINGDAAPRLVEQAARVAERLALRLRVAAPGSADRLRNGFDRAAAAAQEADGPALAAAQAEIRAAVLAGAYRSVLHSVRARDAAAAEAWLLVREFRKPTTFSRPGADATLALAGLRDGTLEWRAALPVIRTDLLDTYQARLRASLAAADEAIGRRFATRASAETALARGYALILADAYRAQRGPAAAEGFTAVFDRLAAAGLAGEPAEYTAARARVDEVLAGFRAAPLAADEQQRRAGQFLRFLALVPIEYGRGVDDGRVTKDFEIQEAITFRDGAAQALGDLEPMIAKSDPGAAARMTELLEGLGTDLALAARGERVASADDVEDRSQEALDLADEVFPESWKETSAADFDVIDATLGRLQGAVAAHSFAKAEQARLEAYAFFEFGPEQRLRGLAPDLFIRVEGLFWYGAEDLPGLAQLIKRKVAPEEIAPTLDALDQALADAEAAVGAGPGSAISVITNTAIIVFREGLEAVLILAALTAGMVGAQRRYRRPMFLGAGAALVASVITFVIAQTVLESLTRYGEKLEAVVSLVAIAVLLLILNWFFHKVYWSEHLAELHGKKKMLLRGAGLSFAAAQLVGLAMLGFSAVYREGFETVLFLQAIVLDAGVGTVIEGVLLGLAAAVGIGVLTLVLQRKLPHKRMLELTGVLILAVLVVMVGKTVQVCQVVGWLPVHPIEGVRLPYWAGAWLGVFPTWEGVIAQGGAVVLVLGSYFGSEWLRNRRRRRILALAVAPPQPRPEERPEVARVESPV